MCHCTKIIASILAVSFILLFVGGILQFYSSQGKSAYETRLSATANTKDTNVSSPSEPGKTSVKKKPEASGESVRIDANTETQPATVSEDTPEFEEGKVLVTLAEGVSVDDFIASITLNSALAGATAEKQTNSYVKIALPTGVTVEDAVAQLSTSNLVSNAQPNYCYYLFEDNATALSSNASTTKSKTANASIMSTSSTEPTEPSKFTESIALKEESKPITNASTLITQAYSTANDSYYVKNKQWELASVNAPEAWDLVNANVANSAAVTVAVVDAGFRITHEDLKEHIVDYYNIANNSTDMGTDTQWHGSHVAGIVGAVTNNGKGVASIGNNAIGLMLLRVSDKGGENITTDKIVDAYTYIVKHAKTHNVRVVNMSLGSYSREPVTRKTDTELYDAIAKAKSAGIVTVSAAGNEEDNVRLPYYAEPSDFDNVVSVINLQKSSNADGVERASTSNYNKSTRQTEKNISAPGTDIYSVVSSSNSSYASQSGTSMSTPLVAGVLALMFTVNPSLSVDSAVTKLCSSAKDLTVQPASVGWDRETGWGEVDAAAAVRAVGATTKTSKKSVATLSISAPDVTYTGSAVMPKVTVKDGSVTLRLNTDYSVHYRDNKETGQATYTVRGIGNYCGIAIGTFVISKAQLKSVKLRATTATCNTKKHKPAIKAVKVAGGTTSVPASDYSVTYLRGSSTTANFKKVGKIVVKVTGKNNCKGSVTAAFTIKPQGTKLTKLEAQKKGLRVQWKSQQIQTTGYQLQIAINKTFSKKVKQIRKANIRVIDTTIGKLKVKKRYYVRIRTYKIVDGKYIYSVWSSVKSVKTK